MVAVAMTTLENIVERPVKPPDNLAGTSTSCEQDIRVCDTHSLLTPHDLKSAAHSAGYVAGSGWLWDLVSV